MLSPRRHNLARLRLDLGLSQKKMANLLGCSAPTVQAIELGKLRMSEKLARTATAATNISTAWLLENCLDADPVTSDGAPYSGSQYENARVLEADAAKEFVTESGMIFDYAAGFYGQIRSILSSAANSRRAEVALWKIGKMLADLRADYGSDETLMPGQAFGTRSDGSLALTMASREAGVGLMQRDLDDRKKRDAEIKQQIEQAEAAKAPKKPSPRSSRRRSPKSA